MMATFLVFEENHLAYLEISRFRAYLDLDING